MPKPTEEQVQLLLMRGHVAGLTEAQQQQVKACAEKLRETIAAADKVEDGIGHIALALVGAELAAED